MKICVASSAPLPTQRAYGIALENTMASMESLGHEVTICAPFPKNPTEITFQPSLQRKYEDLASSVWHYVHRRVGGRLGSALFVFSRYTVRHHFVRLASRRDFQLVWTRDVLLASAAASLGIPVVLEEHHVPSKMQAKRYRRLLRHGSNLILFVGISRPIVDSLLALGVESSRITCEPSGVSSAFFQIAHSRAMGDRPLRLGYFGSGSVRNTDKGLEDLVRVFQFTRTKVQAELFIVGLTNIEREILENQLRHDLVSLVDVFFGPRVASSDVPHLVQKCDVLVAPFPDTEELRGTSPLKLTEYAAAGRPIVATDVPAVRETLPANSFFEYKYGDAESFVEAILSIVQDWEQTKERVGVAGEFASSLEWSTRTRRILSRLGPE